MADAVSEIQDYFGYQKLNEYQIHSTGFVDSSFLWQRICHDSVELDAFVLSTILSCQKNIPSRKNSMIESRSSMTSSMKKRS